MMKKRFALLLAVLLILSALAACGNKNGSGKKSDLETDDSVVPTFERVESRDAAGKVQTANGEVIYDCYTFESVDSESVMITYFYSQTKGSTNAASAETQSYVKCLDPHTVCVPEKLAGKTVVKIGRSAFRQCTEIGDLVLPRTLTSIGTYAFAECVNLQSVALPAALSELGIGVFYHCEALSDLQFAAQSALSVIPNSAFLGCKSLTELHIPGYIKTIEKAAFLNCTAVTTLTLEEGLETIGDQAFQNLGLAEVPALPSTVKSVGILNPWEAK